MKNRSFLGLAALFLLLSATPKNAVESRYTVDVKQSSLQWTGYYVFSFGSHNGTVDLTEGEFYVSEKGIIKGSFEIDMRSIKNLDMKGSGGDESLVDHLKSDDFFSVDTYPKALFEINNVKEMDNPAPDEPNVEITGSLTLKGVSHPLKFPASVSLDENTLTASAKFKFDRTKWNVRYNSGRFFDGIGDGAISDGIGMEIHIVARKTEKL